jgi:hypothetical protein
MVEMIQRYSEQFWMGSGRVRTNLSHPRRYLSPWRAITDHLDLLGGEGTSPDPGREQDALELYVEGHDTDTGRTGTWEGTVVDYVLETAADADQTVVLPEVARLVVETDDGRVTVGGWDAILEDVAAHGLEVRRPQ